MADPLAPQWLTKLGVLLQQESQKQWFSFAMFIVAVLIGALWLEASQVLPGVATTGLLEEGETVQAVVWDSTDERALLLVERTDSTPLRLLTDAGLSEVADAGFTPHAIAATNSGWIIGGESGSVATYDGSGDPSELALDWGDSTASDIISLASLDGSQGWLLTRSGSDTNLHTFSNGVVSAGAPAPTSTTIMSSIHLSEDGSLALILGYDMSFRNPAFGPYGEVLIRAEGVLGQQPNLMLLHHGAGGALHSVSFLSAENWGGDVVAMVAGSSSTLLVGADSSVVNLPFITGSTAATVDSHGTMWFATESDELVSLSTTDEQPQRHTLSASSVVEAKFASAVGDDVEFYGKTIDNDVGRLHLDPSAQDDVGQSLARIGDVVFLIIVVFSLAIVAHSFWVLGLGHW